MSTVEITIHADGQTTLETKGFQGSSCRDASGFLEAVLGATVGEEITAEFHQQSQLAQPLVNRLR